jgi:hypothetical protein
MTACTALLGVALLAGCGIGKPSVTPESPTIRGVSSRGVDLNVMLAVNNPNPFSIVAKGATGSLFLGSGDGKRVGTASADLGQALAAKSTTNVPSDLQIAWTSVSALSEFIGQARVPYRFDGSLALKGGPLDLSVPFQIGGYLERDQLMHLGVDALRNLIH